MFKCEPGFANKCSYLRTKSQGSGIKDTFVVVKKTIGFLGAAVMSELTAASGVLGMSHLKFRV